MSRICISIHAWSACGRYAVPTFATIEMAEAIRGVSASATTRGVDQRESRHVANLAGQAAARGGDAGAGTAASVAVIGLSSGCHRVA